MLQGCSLHCLHELEQQLLAHFQATSAQELQLPGGATSLLALLAQHGELAGAVSGHGDALDVGPVAYESVVAVVAQALTNLRHSSKAQQRLQEGGE